ncbi:MAG: Ppx/GppA family phosphatase [Bacillota bacterium]|jgi:exopolyphosphatase/guanosine-5'-triphosphate,3'-diphosphate pyrophosphatase
MKAAIDIGTNTIRMLVGEVEEGRVKVHRQFLAEPRLGVGITKGILTKEAIERTVKALGELKKVTEDYKLQEVLIVATSAVRDAANKEDFLDEVFQKTGWQVKIITGDEEAFLSYTGALSSLPEIYGVPVIVDIGGGSTEVIFQREGQIKTVSVNVGAVRLCEAGWPHEELNRNLSPLFQEIHLKDKISLVAVGGTATTAATIHFGIKKYCRKAVHGRSIAYEDLVGLKDQLAAMTITERRKVVGLTPKRADIIIPGLEILISILERLGESRVLISDAGILDGILLGKLS